MKIIDQSVSLITHTPHPLQVIERCGRIAWRSEDKITETSAEPFVKMLLKKGHTSVLEHCHATLEITTSIKIWRELERHRHTAKLEAGALTQESTRYCCYDGGVTFINPSWLTDDRWPVWLEKARIVENEYLSCVEQGWKPQEASDFLALNVATTVAFTSNFTEWLHILRLRESPAAHPDMRALMGLIRPILEGVCPEVFTFGKEIK